MIHKNTLGFITVFILSFGFVTSVFQNCSAPEHAQSDVVSVDLPSNHPAGDDQGVTANYGGTRTPLMDTEQITDSMKMAFNPNADANLNTYIEAVSNLELRPMMHLVGGSCEPARRGNLEECAGSISHLADLLVSSTSSTREAARIQVCLRLTSNAGLVGVVVNQVKGASPGPEDESIRLLAAQFYPEGLSEPVVQKLIWADRELASRNATLLDRWRFLTQLLCESPNWEVL